MRYYEFSMGLPAYKIEEYYRGNVKGVVVTCDNGLTLQLPVEVFRPYLTRTGVYGNFRVCVDSSHKLVRIEKR